MDFEFNLGSEIVTKITGFKGIIRGRSQYLTGCNTYGVQSQKLDKDGNPGLWKWFDEGEIVLIKNEKIKLFEVVAHVASPSKPKGGPLSQDQIPRT